MRVWRWGLTPGQDSCSNAWDRLSIGVGTSGILMTDDRGLRAEDDEIWGLLRDEGRGTRDLWANRNTACQTFFWFI